LFELSNSTQLKFFNGRFPNCLDMNEIFVQTTDEVAYDFVEFANTNHYGIEITCFALPWILDGDWKTRLHSYNRALKDFGGEVAIHGVFMDMITASRDAKVVLAARERIFQNIKIAKQLGAKILVLCSCFNPCIAAGSPGYVDGYMQRQIKFWTETLEPIVDSDLTLVFENLWEPQPELVRDLLDGVNSKNFKALLDTGHANIFSKVPLERWVEALKDYLTYIHLNDNRGDFDSNLAPGEGNIKWDKFFNALKRHELRPRICLEVEAYQDRSKLENTKRAIEYLEKMKFYPFQV
jgi:sugar phosphate isomerase/epimerase